ncbi:MAG TPA: SIS domain-containing protein [Candidatus Angelobacter sp.]|nr:SIS domain-containing protein [Candidatus Angelobacter sp.]
MAIDVALATQVEESLLERNRLFEAFFSREAPRLAQACRAMASRFMRNGRLLAFGKGPYATDAQHVSVEFVHPVIVGKRALPALDISAFFQSWLETALQPEDMVMGFAPPEGDSEIEESLLRAQERGAMAFALPTPTSGSGGKSSYSFQSITNHPFLHQELIEILYHTLWETVHVYFEHRELGHNVGEAGFLYPFLGGGQTHMDLETLEALETEVAASIQMKVRDDAALREHVAQEQAEAIVAASQAIYERVQRGGKLIIFGNGGSATDANDLAIDCFQPPSGYRPVPAISLSLEPANISAIANDVGIDVIFLRQLIAHARPQDAVVAISTSGGSRNICMALEEAGKRGLLTVALLGYDGGEIARRKLAQFPLVVSCDYIPRIQEVQASMYHSMREILEVLSRA